MTNKLKKEIGFRDLNSNLQNIIIFTFLLAIICFIFLMWNIFDINNLKIQINNLSKEISLNKVELNCYNQTTLSDGKIIDIKVICAGEQKQ